MFFNDAQRNRHRYIDEALEATTSALDTLRSSEGSTDFKRTLGLAGFVLENMYIPNFRHDIYSTPRQARNNPNAIPVVVVQPGQSASVSRVDKTPTAFQKIRIDEAFLAAGATFDHSSLRRAVRTLSPQDEIMADGRSNAFVQARRFRPEVYSPVYGRNVEHLVYTRPIIGLVSGTVARDIPETRSLDMLHEIVHAIQFSENPAVLLDHADVTNLKYRYELEAYQFHSFAINALVASTNPRFANKQSLIANEVIAVENARQAHTKEDDPYRASQELRDKLKDIGMDIVD